MSPVGFGSWVRRRLVGRPLPSSRTSHERFSRVTGLAVLSSDPLSSVAYATEEILRVLVIAGGAALVLSVPIAVAIAGILLLVVVSYRQTIRAYPDGGGAYVVARDQLGEAPGLLAAAALLIDYVLTVAVSLAAGASAMASAVPALREHVVLVGLTCLVLLTLGNLRGVRDSGRIFAAPTYVFIVALGALLATGLVRWATSGVAPLAPAPVPAGAQALTLLLILRAFANGCTAMTGVEAVSNGVPAFRAPEVRNATATLAVMGAVSITLFVGLTLLSQAFGVLPADGETVLSQLARAVFGGRTPAYYLVQAATVAILVLAANTAFADFPRLASILARDGYLPRQLRNRGDRLAFSNGILGLSAFAAVLLVAFDGDTHALIPLYMVGVFLAFTLSQAGMVARWWRLREPGWRAGLALNAAGASVTGVVLGIVALTKAAEGAWITLLLLPIHVAFFRLTRGHYTAVAEQLTLRHDQPRAFGPPRRHVVVVPISGVHRAVLRAVEYAACCRGELQGLYVDLGDGGTDRIRQEWRRWCPGVPLEIVESPYRSLLEPLTTHLDSLEAAGADRVTVVLPELVPARWWQHLFHNQRALLLKGFLLLRPRVVVTSVPFHLAR